MLHGAITFWKLDLFRAYMHHHILVEPSDVPKMAVIMAFRLFKFSWMPFGLRNEAQTFQHFMDQVLCGLTFALASYPGTQEGGRMAEGKERLVSTTYACANSGVIPPPRVTFVYVSYTHKRKHEVLVRLLALLAKTWNAFSSATTLHLHC